MTTQTHPTEYPLHLGGLKILLRSNAPHIQQELEEIFKAFSEPLLDTQLPHEWRGAKPHLEIDVILDLRPVETSPPPVKIALKKLKKKKLTASHDYRIKRKHLPEQKLQLSSNFFRSIFDQKKKKATLWLFSQPTRLQTTNFLLAVLPLLLLENQGLLLHSSGVIHQEQAFLFTGPSTAGKSTTIRNSLDKELLSDELVILRQDSSGQFWAFGTPFYGDWQNGINRCAPLKSISFINKSKHHKIIKISLRKKFKKLFQIICFPDPDKKQAEKISNISEQLLTHCHQLDLLPNPGFWSLLEKEE